MQNLAAIPLPPTPTDPYEAARWNESRRRRRLLDGAWKDDLREKILRRIGATRAEAWGDPELEVNPFESICRELAVLYASPPVVRHDRGNVDDLVKAISLSGLWGLMARVQSYVIGLREYFVRVHVTKEGKPTYRRV